MMWIGIWLLFSPIISLLNWIPLVGYLLAHGFSFVVMIFALILSITLTLLTIALAWVYYRPLYGMLLLTGVGACIGLMFLIKNEEKTAGPTPSPAPAPGPSPQ